VPGKLRQLSGAEVRAILEGFGFAMVKSAGKGSHVKLRRTLPDGRRQTLVVPNHHEIDRGTLRAIFRQASRFVPESELHPHFYCD
jgi:predicted RNA binding protein YcfA (HicA-like mRNA interferase family)